MTLYLVRHGEAVDETKDPARPLNKRGREEVAVTARVAARLDLEVERIVHSGKLRARQTAEIWAAALGRQEQIEEFVELEPLADPEHARAFIEQAREPLMLVGHLPHLGRLAAALLLGDPEKELIRYPTGATLALVPEDGAWRIKWLLTPKLARAVSS